MVREDEGSFGTKELKRIPLLQPSVSGRPCSTRGTLERSSGEGKGPRYTRTKRKIIGVPGHGKCVSYSGLLKRIRNTRP